MVKIEIFNRMFYSHSGASGENLLALKQCSDNSALLVRFDDYAHPFLVVEYRCSDPQCTCKTLLLEFTEINEVGHPIAGPVQFSISLNISTWKENDKPKRSRMAQHFAKVFMENLTSDIKRQICNSVGEHQESIDRSLTFKMSNEDIKGGVMVSYRDVFRDSDDQEPGKVSIYLSYEHQGKIYFVHDVYCINPQCECAEVRLHFLWFKKDKADEVHDIFMCNLSFEDKIDKMEILEVFPSFTLQQATKLYETWNRKHPDFLELLKDRYRRIKEVGRQLLEENKKNKPSLAVKKKIRGKKRKKKRKK